LAGTIISEVTYNGPSGILNSTIHHIHMKKVPLIFLP